MNNDDPLVMTITVSCYLRAPSSGDHLFTFLAPASDRHSMVSFATSECGGEEQTVDHVFLPCPIHRPPHGLHGLTILDDETIKWLLNTCPEI